MIRYYTTIIEKKGGGCPIRSFLERLENLCKREQLKQTVKKELKAGETWIYPLRLEKGIKYSSSTSSSDAAMSVKPSLLNYHKRPICESGKGRKTCISFVRDENGFHKLMVAVAMREEGKSLSNRFVSAKVSITVKKERGPCRAFPWWGLDANSH